MYSQFAEAAQRAGRPEDAAELRSHKAAVFSGEEMYRCLIRKDQLLPDELKNHPAINSSVLIVVSIHLSLPHRHNIDVLFVCCAVLREEQSA